MNVKKAIKSIAAVAVGAAMIGSTVLGAADLASYPSNMITDGAFNGKIVIGLNAKPQDVIAAIDIATSLQASSVKETTVSTSGASGTSYSVSGGKEISKTTSKLNLGETFSAVLPNGFSEEDFPDMLADGTVTDDSSSDDVDFEQKIYLSNKATTAFTRDNAFDAFGNDPVPVITFSDDSSNPAYTLVVDFKGDKLNMSALTDSETITMFGKEFTFDTSIGKAAGDDIVLYTSSATETLAIGESKTVKIDGKDTTFEVLGGNTDKETALIKIDGVTKQVEADMSYTVGGKDFRVKSIFATTVPTDSVAVEIMVGSDKISFDSDDTNWQPVYDNDGETIDGLKVKVNGLAGINDRVEKITFGVFPNEVSDENGDDSKYLLEGKEFVTPVFDTVKVKFAGVSPELSSTTRSTVEFQQSGKDLKMVATGIDGNKIDLVLVKADAAGKLLAGKDVALGQSKISKNQYFVLNENDGGVRQKSIVYKLKDISLENSNPLDAKSYVEFENVGTTSTFKIYGNEQALRAYPKAIGDSSMYVNFTSTFVTLKNAANATTRSDYTVYVKDDLALNLGGNTTGLDALQTVGGLTTAGFRIVATEDAFGDIVDETAPNTPFRFSLATNADGDRVKVGSVNITKTANDDGDNEYSLTKLGTYVSRAYDSDDTSLVIATSPVELTYSVFVAPSSQVSVTAGSASGVKTTTVNPIPVGVAISDEDAMGLIGKSNLIVVGGPVVNTVMAKLKGNPSSEAIAAEYKPGVGLVEIYDKTDFAELGTKVALLVSGYEWADTQRAARAVAQHSDKNFKGSAIEVHGTSTTISEIKAME